MSKAILPTNHSDEVTQRYAGGLNTGTSYVFHLAVCHILSTATAEVTLPSAFV